MQRPWLFFLGVLIILAIFTLGCWGITTIAGLAENQIQGFYYSGILALLNIVGAFVIIKFAIVKDQKQFARVFLLGMAARLIFLLIMIFIVFNYTQVDHFVFIGSLFILYFIFQIWEVVFINANYKKGI